MEANEPHLIALLSASLGENPQCFTSLINSFLAKNTDDGDDIAEDILYEGLKKLLAQKTLFTDLEFRASALKPEMRELHEMKLPETDLAIANRLFLQQKFPDLFPSTISIIKPLMRLTYLPGETKATNILTSASYNGQEYVVADPDGSGREKPFLPF